jgi:hypothetical protein
MFQASQDMFDYFLGYERLSSFRGIRELVVSLLGSHPDKSIRNHYRNHYQ